MIDSTLLFDKTGMQPFGTGEKDGYVVFRIGVLGEGIGPGVGGYVGWFGWVVDGGAGRG